MDSWCAVPLVVSLVAGTTFPGAHLVSAVPSERTVSSGRPAAATIPYGLDRRADPADRALEDILPLEIGPFSRQPFQGQSQALPVNADLNVDYACGTRVVTVGFVVAPSAALAREAVRAARGMADTATSHAPGAKVRSQMSASLDGDPAFVKTDDFIAWSRGRHFFYAKADTAGTLDAFMAHFPD